MSTVTLAEVVALALIERVDARDVLRDLRGVDRLSDQEVDAVLDGAGRDPVRPLDLDVAENRRSRTWKIRTDLPPTISHVVQMSSSNWFVA